jgi:VanZ family protein
METRTKNWILVFLWTGLIFFLSHQPYLKSDLPGQWYFFLRKIAHITEYAILTFLLIRALKGYQLTNGRVLILATSLAIAYAIFDEYHQTLISGREGTPRDVLIDSLGVFWVTWLKKRKMI